jgi:hypothetical protein
VARTSNTRIKATSVDMAGVMAKPAMMHRASRFREDANTMRVRLVKKLEHASRT